MRSLTLAILILSSVCFADELPVVKLPTKNDIEKAKIKNLIKALDDNKKEEKPKKEKQESSQLNDSQNSHLHQNYPSSSKYFFKKNKSKLFCPT